MRMSSPGVWDTMSIMPVSCTITERMFSGHHEALTISPSGALASVWALLASETTSDAAHALHGTPPRPELQRMLPLLQPRVLAQPFATCSWRASERRARRHLEERAREYSITDLQPLFTSAAFLQEGFQVDSQRQAVTFPR